MGAGLLGHPVPAGWLGPLPGGISLLKIQVLWTCPCALFSHFVLVFSRLVPAVFQGLLCCCVHVVLMFPDCLCELITKKKKHHPWSSSKEHFARQRPDNVTGGSGDQS